MVLMQNTHQLPLLHAGKKEVVTISAELLIEQGK